MNYAELKRTISERKIPGLLFLYGEETFFRDRAVTQIRDAVVPPDARDFNYNVYEGKDIQPEVVLDNALTLPVFAPQRLILVKNAQDIPASGLEEFIPYLKNPVTETILVFTGDKIDGRKKFFQTFKKHGTLVEFKKLYDNQIPAFVKEQAREAGRSFTEDSLALFCKRTGSNLQEVHGELFKLFSYVGERKLVEVSDVAAVVSDSKVDSIFDLTNAMGQQNIPEALRLLGRILSEGVAPLAILSMMVRHFRQLWKARELMDQNCPRNEIARGVGVNPYFLDKLLAQARQFPPERLPSVFERFLEVDLALKSSGAHPSALLEKLILDVVAGQKSCRR